MFAAKRVPVFLFFYSLFGSSFVRILFSFLSYHYLILNTFSQKVFLIEVSLTSSVFNGVKVYDICMCVLLVKLFHLKCSLVFCFYLCFKLEETETETQRDLKTCLRLHSKHQSLDSSTTSLTPKSVLFITVWCVFFNPHQSIFFPH